MAKILLAVLLLQVVLAFFIISHLENKKMERLEQMIINNKAISQ